MISTFVWLSPFLYSSGQSSSRMRGRSMRRRILEWVTSLLNMTPSRTAQSDSSPPGIFSSRTYRLMSTSVRSPTLQAIWRTALMAMSTIWSPHRAENLVPMAAVTISRRSLLLSMSIVRQMRPHTSSAFCSALV